MDGELVEQSTVQQGEQIKSYKDIIYKQLPVYMVMGMTVNDYLHGDCTLVIYYREAYKLKQEQMNYQLWLQGMYVYEAILDASPILHDFVKRGTKPIPYVEKPYCFDVKEIKDEENKNKFYKGLGFVSKWANKVNEKKIS